jgi:predicted nucleic acid-binding protein
VIAIDSSSWIAFFSDTEPSGDDTALVESALADHQACLPPVVLTELLSDPKLPKSLAGIFADLPLLEPHAGYWGRAGRLRAKLIAQRHRARLADSLIAQACIDHEVRLITRDDHFLHFSRLGRLRLALSP